MFCDECQAAVAIGTAANTRSLYRDGPFEHLHAAHRAADDGKQLIDTEMIDQARLRFDHVADGDDGKIKP